MQKCKDKGKEGEDKPTEGSEQNGEIFPKAAQMVQGMACACQDEAFWLSQLCALCPHCRHRSWTVVTCEAGFSSKSENLLLIHSSSKKTFPQTDCVQKTKRLEKLRWPYLPCYAF